MSIFVCITTRDGKPDFGVVQAAQAACEYHGDARLGSTDNAHNVCVSRNKGVAKLLSDESFSHILFVDNDTIIPVDAISKLAGLEANVATGCVPTTVKAAEKLTPFIAVASSMDDQSGAITWHRHWFDGVRETEACGAACLLIARDVFEQIGFPWFRWPERLEGGHHQFHSEDVDFCRRIGQSGLGPILAHGQVRCRHDRLVDVGQLIEDERSLWGSHLEVLENVGRSFPDIRSVLEYGCGRYSTPIFLDRDIFPSVDRVDSFESDHAWARKIRTECPDERLVITEYSLSDMVDRAVRADLVFIDCGAAANGSGVDYSTRAWLLDKHAAGDDIVVLHDAEQPLLARAVMSSAYQHKTVFHSSGPDTAVLSNARSMQPIEV